MSYINSKATRIYVNPDPAAVDTVPDTTAPGFVVGDLTTAGWVFVRGVRNDSAQNNANSTPFYHYGEPDAVSVSAPPDRSFSIPSSEDLVDPGQMILRWASENEEQIGVLLLKDGLNGYAVAATVTGGTEEGTAQGTLRSTDFRINPIDQRVYVGVTSVYTPGS